MGENMKPSGIAWIGDIPESWEVSKVKFDFVVVNGSTPDSSDYDCWDGQIKWITPADMNETGIIDSGDRSITEFGYNSCGTTLLPKGSIVISSRAPIGKINITTEVLCTNQGCKGLVAKRDNRFTYYLMLAGHNELTLLGRGTTFLELSTYDLTNFKIVIPPLHEQTHIADFLDEQCEKIDNIATDIEKQIEILQKYKKSLIAETVTKGLDKLVSMKDSGIEWIGDVPENYSLVPLKNLFWMYAGGDVDEYDFSDERTDKYKYAIYSNSLENNGLFGYMSKYRFKGDTITVTGRGDVGKALPRYDAYYPIVRLLVCVPQKKLNVSFFSYCINCADILGDQTAMAQLTIQKLGVIKVPVPAYEEQSKIANYLDKKCLKIDSIIESKKEQLTHITQHKKSLIYEYVTGKKRVKGANNNGN